MTGSSPLIRKYQLFKIGLSLRSQEFTGTLTITESEGATIIFFDGGEPVRATSSLVSLSFPAFLLRKRRVERPRLKELLDEASARETTLEEVLRRRQVLSAKELMRLKRELSEYIFAIAFHKEKLPYCLVPGPVDQGERGRVRDRLQLHEALFRAVATDKEVEGLSRMFADRWDYSLAKSADFYRYLLQFRSAFYGEDISEALMAAELSAQAIIDDADDKESALRQLVALSLAGMLSFDEGEARDEGLEPFSPTAASVETMEEVEENKTLVFMPDDIPTQAAQTEFLGSAMPFQVVEPDPPRRPVAEEPERPESLQAFLDEGFGGPSDNGGFEDEMLGAASPGEPAVQVATSSEPVSEPTPAPVALAVVEPMPAPEPALELEEDEEFEIEVVLEDGSPALGGEKVVEEEEEPTIESAVEKTSEELLQSGGEKDVSEADVEELLRKAVVEAQKKDGVRTVEPTDSFKAPPEGDVEEEVAAVGLALADPPPPPPRPNAPEEGTDESIERILEDVYRSMLSRNLYQVLNVSNTTPISAIRDAAARVSAKYSPEQYKGYMLSGRAKTILEYVQRELERALTVLTERGQRISYDDHVGTQYDGPTAEVLSVLFDAEDALMLGVGAQRGSRWTDAVENFSAATELNPRDPDYLAYLGWATYQVYKSGQSDDSFASNKARNILERTLALDSRNPRALLFIARIEKEMGNVEAARVWFERLHKLEPTNEEVNAALEWLRMSAGIERRTQSGFWNWLSGIFTKK
jgi:tetratricopeptide (TPR) repeat protein